MTDGITYRTTGPWGPGKGANLVAEEVDANFWEIEQRLDGLEADPPVPAGIVDATVAGGRITFHLSSGASLGPHILPQATFAWQGEWADATAYAAMDVVHVPGLGVFLVLAEHVAAAPFDPDAETTEGPLYHMVFGLPPGGTSIVRDEAADTYQLALADAAHFLRFTHAAGCEVTIPANAAAAFPVSTEIALRQSSLAGLAIVVAGGVSLLPVEGHSFTTAFRGAVVRLKKTGTNEWVCWGDLAPDDATEGPSEAPTA